MPHNATNKLSSRVEAQKRAAELLGGLEKQLNPIRESCDQSGRVMFDIVKPPIEERKQFVVWFEPPKRKKGRPNKRNRLKDGDLRGMNLERAIYSAISKNTCQRTVRAITLCIITDKASEYYRSKFDWGIYNRVGAAIRERGKLFWDRCKGEGLATGEPSADLVNELGLQSLKWIATPFGGRMF
jgi:hypothetical protein